ncbi:MAG: gliding motility-associated C-terminal domain-containing protein, partial [Draconibacterium sp.]
NDILTCLNTTDTLDASTAGDVTYLWNTGETSATIEVTAPADYSVIVTDASSGCVAYDTVTVNQDIEKPIVIIDGTLEICDYDSTTLSTDNSEFRGTPVYTWFHNGSILSNETGSTLTANESGEYVVEIKDGINGCTNTDTVDIVVLESTEETINRTVCDQLTINDSIYTESGTYEQHLVNAAGCDSTLIINLTVNDSREQTFTASSCDSYELNDSVYTESGRYIQYLKTEDGCDLTITLNLTILKSTMAIIDTTVCSRLTINNETFTQSGTYRQTMPNAVGCDSTLIIRLTVNHPTYATDVQTACDEFTWIDGNTYTESNNTATYILENAAGCDSIVSLDLTILNSTSKTIVASDCESYTINGESYYETGIYEQHLTNAAGCDSTLIIDVTIGDDEVPVAVCNDLTVQLDSFGIATISVEDIEGGSTDNCGIDTMFISQETFRCGQIGENEVTLTVIDKAGNASTCTATVTVEVGEADCGQVRLLAQPDILTLVVCPGGTVNGEFNLLANDEGIGSSGITLSAENIPANVDINLTNGQVLYANEELSEAVIQFTYTICSNADVENCSSAEATIHVLLDTDCDGIPDVDDIDDDDDGILDIHEDANALNQKTLDSDGDGIVDRLDIDSDNDGIPDNIEWQQNTAEGILYAENGGVNSGFDYYPPLGTDSNGDGWDDQYDDQGVYYDPVDMDLDGIPDYLDNDTDNDNYDDATEGFDANFDKVADYGPLGTDSDNDGLDDAYDSYDTSNEWLHGKNAIGTNAPLKDENGNGVRDWREVKPEDPDTTDAATGCELFIPDGFSPNGDNRNDYFEIIFNCQSGDLLFEEEYPDARIEIFNRWGNKVYEQENYGNTVRWGTTDAWWNGKSTNKMQVGKDNLPTATYFYILYLNDGTDPITGSIFLNN